MEAIEILGYVGALSVGLILGLTGSGGSLMAVPILTYLFHINPVSTAAYSLFVVGTSASVGTVNNFKKGMIDLRTALVFAIPCFLNVFAMRKFLMPLLPDKILSIGSFELTKSRTIMLLFAFLVCWAAISMMGKGRSQITRKGILKWKQSTLLVFQGTVIGILTGIVGIGGGFLIVPVLVLSIGMPIKKAVATSLLIIALKSLGGFVGDLGHFAIDWSFLLLFTLISILGIVVGLRLSKQVQAKKLKKGYGWFMLVVAFGIFYRELVWPLSGF